MIAATTGEGASAVSIAGSQAAAPTEPAETESHTPGLLTSAVIEQTVRRAAAAPAAGSLQLLKHVLTEARTETADELARLLGRLIAELDELINRQLNAILHHERFQQLEASWRGVRFLVHSAEYDENIKIRVLQASWKEVASDTERALEFDQSQLFRKIYSDGIGMPGADPFSVILGDYQIHLRPSREHPHDDMSVLESLAGIAAAAFAPFVAAADPSLLGIDSFSELHRQSDLARAAESPDFVKWNAFRRSDDARFVGLLLPRVLMRVPYHDAENRVDLFPFREEVEAPEPCHYLWGNAIYAFGRVLIRAFAETGWLADIRGVRQDEDAGGLVTDLPVHSFSTDPAGIARKICTEIMVGDEQERDLGELGFIPLCHLRETGHCAFYSVQSVNKPASYDRAAASANARLSATLPYILCAARFAHYVKAMAREQVGSFAGATELQNDLQKWLMKYVTPDDHATVSDKARYPLREAQVEVRERLGQPGSFACIMRLRPHFQLDALTASIRLVSEELVPAKTH